jgi:hypothetical protein
MLHDNRDRVRQRVETPPQSAERAANIHRRNRAIEVLQSPTDRSQFSPRVRELRADLAPWRLIAHADARAENVPPGRAVIERSSRRADQQSAFSPHGDALALSIVAVPTRACEPEIAFIPARAASLTAPVVAS